MINAVWEAMMMLVIVPNKKVNYFVLAWEKFVVTSLILWTTAKVDQVDRRTKTRRNKSSTHLNAVKNRRCDGGQNN